MEAMLAFSRFFSVGRGLTVAAAFATLSPLHASAQAQAEAERLADAVVQQRRGETTLVYPYGLSGTPLTGAGLVAGQEDKRVFIRLGRPLGRIGEVGLSASAPLDENADRSAVVQLDGLANTSKVGAEVRLGAHRLPSAQEVAAILNDQSVSNLTKCLEEAARARAALKEKPDEDIIVTPCADLGPVMRRDAMRVYRRTAWFLTLKGDIGPERYEFVEGPTVTELTERKWSRSGSIVGGALLPNNVYTSVGIRMETAFEAADQQAVCTAAPPATCPLHIVGAPSSVDRGVVEVEVRRFLSTNAGLSGIVRHDWKRDETSLEVPIYLVRNKDGGLTGGVSIGHLWSDDEKQQGARFTVFVGQLFSLSQ